MGSSESLYLGADALQQYVMRFMDLLFAILSQMRGWLGDGDWKLRCLSDELLRGRVFGCLDIAVAAAGWVL